MKSAVKSSPSVAVIDIGSNSVKVLVAVRDAHGQIEARLSRTIDARISAGIGRDQPRLSDKGMAGGLAAVEELQAAAMPHLPAKFVVVATSAVRDAANGGEFRNRVRAATGLEIRILGGDEEANYIGRGLTCDPALAELRDFFVFDLGGGSLECLLFNNRQVQQAISLPLGCVRMTERFVKEAAAPLVVAETTALALHVRDELKRSGFPFPIVAPAAVFTGGSMTTVRVLKGALHGQPLEATPAVIGVATLAHLLEELAPLTIEERRAVPGMPAARADVLPAALVTMLAVADYAHVDRFHHSLYNLRWGMAAEALDKL